MFMNMYGHIFMATKNKRNFETDYVKAVKKIMREEYGIVPTRIAKSKKAYNRNKIKNDDRNNNLDD